MRSAPERQRACWLNHREALSRVDPEVHRKAALAAELSCESLNQ
ncbi:toxin-antitoxin system HicB family antitoxin [Roseinatronobacter sp.]